MITHEVVLGEAASPAEGKLASLTGLSQIPTGLVGTSSRDTSRLGEDPLETLEKHF